MYCHENYRIRLPRPSTDEIIARHQRYAPQIAARMNEREIRNRTIDYRDKTLEQLIKQGALNEEVSFTAADFAWLKSEIFIALAGSNTEHVIFQDAQDPSAYLVRRGGLDYVDGDWVSRPMYNRGHNHPLAAKCLSFILTPSAGDLCFDDYGPDPDKKSAISPTSNGNILALFGAERFILTRLGYCYFTKPSLPENLRSLMLKQPRGMEGRSFEEVLRWSVNISYPLYKQLMRELYGTEITFVPMTRSAEKIHKHNNSRRFFEYFRNNWFAADWRSDPVFPELHEMIFNALVRIGMKPS